MKNNSFIIFNLDKVKRFRTLLTLTAFDTSTEHGRSSERYRRSIITTITTILAKIISFCVFAVSIPLTIDYLGKERFGLWMTMSTIILVANIFSDLGLGTALMNKTSEMKGSENKDLLRGYTSSTFFLLIIVAVVIAVSYTILSLFLDWSLIFKLTEQISISEVNSSIWMLVIIFSISLPFVVTEKFQEGNQEGYLNNVWQSLGNLVALFGIIVLIRFELGLPYLILVSFGIPTVFRIANFIYQFYKKNSWAKPGWDAVSMNNAEKLLRIGFVFFMLNIFNVLGVHSDNFVISSTMGASEVALYGILQKLSLTALIFWSFTSSLWPAYAEAIARGDYEWVRITIKRNLLMSLVSGILIGLMLIAMGDFVIGILTKSILKTNLSLLVGFAGYIFVTGFVASIAVIFNSSFLYKRQMVYFITASCVSFGLKFLLGDLFGTLGVIWATSLGYALFYVLPAFVILNNVFWKKSNHKNEKDYSIR